MCIVHQSRLYIPLFKSYKHFLSPDSPRVQAAFYAIFSGPLNNSVIIPPTGFTWNGEAYAAITQLNMTGSYQISVKRGPTHVSGSPTQLQVLPSATSATQSLAFGPALDTIIAGIASNITVQVSF